jgi:NitT/TauT family transport system substrate-binding protein
MKWSLSALSALIIGVPILCNAQAPQSMQSDLMPTASYKFKAAIEQPTFEWFFLLVDAGRDLGIWAKNGLDPEFVAAAGSSAQLKERVDAGVQIGFVNAAEVPLARYGGLPVKTIAGYFGETTARIFVEANSPIKTVDDLDGKKIGVIAATHTSYRTVLYLNKKTGIRAEPVPLGSLASNVAALKSRQIDAFYSAEGAALTLVAPDGLRLLLPLSEIYPKPYTAVVVWATDVVIERNPDLVMKFVRSTLDIVEHLKADPSYASDLYIKRTNSSKSVADTAVASLNKVLTPSGLGSGHDLVAAAAGNWQFMTESGAVADGIFIKMEDVVDNRFLPGK